jgi:predicted Rossmann fold nucleotide-binding protein DprA/Smf involved in DNA uptake
MTITADSQAILLLCSHLALSSETDPAPLTRREWNRLARKIQASSLRHPESLLGLEAAQIQKELDLDESEATRLAELLQRNHALEIELERLADHGIYVLTRADRDYPQRYRERLKESTPVVLFYAGEAALLGQPGIAVVGSRHLDQAGQECATFVGNACGLSGLVLYSGGAKGVDTISMNAALEVRGTAVGILAHSLEKTIRASELRGALGRGDLCLATPYSPNAGFNVGAAMGRNKLIYTLADYAIVVASDAHKGGTWSGATETLKAGWVPVFALEHAAMPDGNRLLIEKGAISFPHPFPEHYSKLSDWLQEHSPSPPAGVVQLGLF